MKFTTLNSLEDLYIKELRDLYSAEKQLLSALPKMAKGAHDADLKKAFEGHLKETEGHVSRLEKIFDRIGEKPTGETCAAMEGLIKEAHEYLSTKGDENVCDAGIIGAAQRIEHYEIAAYGTTRTLARHLEEEKDEALLQATLDEEGAADKKLTKIAESGINEGAPS